MSVTCQACQTANRDTARCCTACGTALVLVCPQCSASNKIGARFCVQCGYRFEVSAPEPALPPMKFMFEDEPQPSTRARPIGVYVGVAAVLLVAVGALGWFMFAQPGVSAALETAPSVAAPEQAIPMSPSGPSTGAAASSTDTAVGRSEPLEEVLESTPTTLAESAPAVVPTPAAAQPAFTPVTVPRVADAAPLPIPAPTQAAKSSRSDDAPWAPQARAPLSPADTLARLRGALAQCAAMSNELSRSNCLARTRQNFCGDAWGRIPECPAGN